MKNVLSNGRCARWRDDETFILLPGNKDDSATLDVPIIGEMGELFPISLLCYNER